MLSPPPPDPGDGQFSERPILNATPHRAGGEPLGNVPQGDELFAYVLNCLDHGSTRKEIRAQMFAFGYAGEDADEVIESVAAWRRQNPGLGAPTNPAVTAGGNSSATTNMLVGGLVCVVGLVITVGSCVASSGPGGGSYVVAWGAIVFGAIQFFRGLSQAGQGSSEP